MRRFCCAIALVSVVGPGLVACSENESHALPAPKLAKFLHDGYTVTAQERAELVPGEPAAVIVTSAGPGLTPSTPVAGGTGDVQVLTYDSAAERWIVAFDAANALSVSQGPGAPVLDQSHPITDVTAKVVRFADSDRPRVAIWGLDSSTNHPPYVVGVVSFAKGSATLEWRSSGSDPDDLGLEVPVVSGKRGRQVLKITAAYATSQDGACCPTRSYTRTVSLEDGRAAVTSDDRPYLGAYTSPIDDYIGARVLYVDPSSPATGKLKPGDVVAGVGDRAQVEPGTDVAPNPIIDALAIHKAGETIDFHVLRGSDTKVVAIKVGSFMHLRQAPTPPEQGRLAIEIDPDTFTITGGADSSPLLDAGAQVGDTLIRVNGRAVDSITSILEALWGTAGQPVSVTYRDRRGVSHPVMVTPIDAGTGTDSTSPAFAGDAVIDHL